MYLIGRATSMSIFAMNTATLLGLAVAIDYALFMVSRFREELHKGATVKEAVGVTTARAGRSVFFSGLAVMVGVVGLVFFPSPGLRSLGIGGALVVFFSVAVVGHLPARPAGCARPPGGPAPGHPAARSPRGQALAALGQRAGEAALGCPSSRRWSSSPCWPRRPPP